MALTHAQVVDHFDQLDPTVAAERLADVIDDLNEHSEDLRLQTFKKMMAGEGSDAIHKLLTISASQVGSNQEQATLSMPHSSDE